MKKTLRGFGTILKRTFKGWNADDPFRQSSVIAYYAIFSFPALLVLVMNVVGLFFKKEVVNGEISRQIAGVLGADTAEQVQKIVEKASEVKAGIIPGIIAVVTMIFGATGVFIQLQKTLNAIWDIREKPDLGFLQSMKIRLFSFGLVLSIGFLLLVSLVISSVLAAVSHWMESVFPDAIAYLFYVLEFAVSLSVISVLFALMFRFLPDAKVPWRTVWVGAILTGFLFILGKYALSLYFGKASPGSVYGVAGSVILLLLWTSYSSMILFFGAEFTKQYAVFHGEHIEPTKDAEPIGNCENPNNPAGTSAKSDDHKRAVHMHGDTHGKKKSNMKKITRLSDIDDEVALQKTRVEASKALVKEKMEPVRIASDILRRRKNIPQPTHQELVYEGMEFAIHLLTGVVMKRSPGNLKSLTSYALSQIARNYVYGQSDPWVDYLKQVLNIHVKGPATKDGLADEHFFDVTGGR